MEDRPAPTLRQLRALTALGEARSFRRAAERLGIAQPSLSAQIQGLEATLGRQLVERSRTAALLTPYGRAAEQRAHDILAAVDALVEEMESASAGTLRLGVTPTLGPYLLPAAVADLHARSPETKLYIREAPPRALARELSDGLHDVVVTHLPVIQSGLVSEELFRERLLLIVARDHPLASKPEILRSDLSGLEVLSLDARYQLHDQVITLCESFGARLLQSYEGTSLDALRQMTGLGMGVTFLPQLYVRSEIRADSEVVARELQGRAVFRSIGLAWRQNAPRAQSFEELAATLRRTFRQLADR
ncbi:MAG: hydrogen peroxide-inducible genes activator [Pseudomonadota bacterium]